ncbi:MAG: hypothetical protein M3066_09165 [Actinomycetota bacterium]|nr:hypothetical protein [Actinomycetota bacterium]
MLAAVLAAALLVGCGGSGGRTTTGSAATPVGGFAVGRLAETFVDTRRPTPANGDVAAQPARTLVTTLLYPAAVGSAAGGRPVPIAPGGPFPLIVFAHGFTGSPAAYDGLIRSWAAAGYVVAAPTFPLSNGMAPGGPTQNDLPNQPGDVSFVITQVLLLAHGDGPLRGAVDPGHMAVAGHSMGASTTLGVVLNTCCHDDRVTAAVVLSGNEIPLPNGQFTASDPTPTLFVHGDADEVVPYSAGRQAFADSAPPKFFVTLPGADHVGAFTGAMTGTRPTVVIRTTVDFFDRYLKGRADGLTRLRSDGTQPGVASLEAVER